MLNSKVNLFKKDWIDTVFEERNKEYGAYDLRKRESRITVRATIIGVVIFSLLVSTPLLVKKIGSGMREGRTTIDETVTLVDLLSTPPDIPETEFVPPPPPVKEIQSLKEVKKFTPPVVAPDEEVVEEIVSQEVLKTALAGAQNIDASEDGEIVIDEKPVDHAVEQKIIEDNVIHDMKAVQVQPEYPGGIQEFMKFVVSKMESSMLQGDLGTVRMQFRFVIEKDGRLTDIVTLNDGGHPDLANVAKNVLSWSPKWQPGVNNGRPVRVAYTIPIIINFQN